jgi:hypothetical protein
VCLLLLLLVLLVCVSYAVLEHLIPNFPAELKALSKLSKDEVRLAVSQAVRLQQVAGGKRMEYVVPDDQLLLEDACASEIRQLWQDGIALEGTLPAHTAAQTLASLLADTVCWCA